MARSILAIAALSILTTTGCQSFHPNATTGGLLGATTGGLVGASIGSHEGKSGEGALVGALAGGLTGAAIGDQIDQTELRAQQIDNARVARIQQSAVSIQDVVQMSQSGLGEELIVNQINANGIASRASTQDLIQMKSNGVSDPVISAFQNGPLAGSNTMQLRRPVEPMAVAPRPVLIEPQLVPVCPAPPVLHYPPPPRFRRAARPRAGFRFEF